MVKTITIAVEEDVYEKFCIALSLTKDDQKSAFEKCMKWYISRSFEKASQIYSPIEKKDVRVKTDMDDYGKANRRIPVWAVKPEQYNHKIIRAYFKAAQTLSQVTLTDMERLCSDRNVPELYVPTFRSNYAQMKIDAPRSHGKVFVDDGDVVTIWDEVKDTLMKHKHSFIE